MVVGYSWMRCSKKKHPDHHGIPIQADYFYIVQQGSFSVSKAEGDGKEGTSNSTPPLNHGKSEVPKHETLGYTRDTAIFVAYNGN